jgi:protein-arginine kinase activator protein McsA
LNELKRSLEEAVSKEDYESAATIRDEIRQLELEEQK